MTPTEREAYAKVLDPRYRQIMQGEPSVTAWLRNAGPSLTQPGTMRPGADREAMLADALRQDETDRQTAPLARLFGSVPFGHQLASALKASMGGEGSWGHRFDVSMDTLNRQRSTYEEPQSQSIAGAALGHAAEAASALPQMAMSPLAQALWSGTAAASRGGGPGETALEAGINFVPSGGPSGPLAVGMTAYHGSPHTFDRFSMDKIGTGEGAQAYSHGLYSTSEPRIGEEYRKQLSRNQPFRFEMRIGGEDAPTSATIDPNGGQFITHDASANATLARKIARIQQSGGDKVDAARQAIQETATEYINDAELHRLQGMNDVAAAYRAQADRLLNLDPSSIEVNTIHPGAFYELDIPDEAVAKFMDWDRPIGEQPHLLDALSRLDAGSQFQHGIKYDPDAWARLQDIQQAKHEIGNIDPVTPEIRAKWDELTAAEEQIQKANPWLLDSGGENPTGQTLYEALARRGSPASASKALREAGIPGMTYIGDSSGARNYVTYDDALMNIKGRYPSMAEWQKAKGAK